MAMFGKQDNFVHVPWSCVEEWLLVYKQIYSGDLTEQRQACDTMLLWKARIPKLSVGVECTLGLMQVFLRDQEWTPKINKGEMLITCENDLRMMYSTVIMKFLNHISNIANTKQISLFVIAKQFNIPQWIINLRHDIAHGHELPSVDVMRIVSNILLTWIHDEYWSAEAKNLQESQDKKDADKYYSEDEEHLIDLIELWTAIGLYMKTNHLIMSDLRHIEIKNSLKKFFTELNSLNTKSSSEKQLTLTDEMELSTISKLLLSEISKNLNKDHSLSRKEIIVIDSILNNEAFLPNSEILSIFLNKSDKKMKNCLPLALITFWKDFLLLMQEKKILFKLFLGLLDTIKSHNDTNNKLMAALWVKTIAEAYRKQKIARREYVYVEQKLDDENKKSSLKLIIKMVEEEMVKKHPELNNILSLNVSGDFPNCLMDTSFIKRVILSYNEYAEHYVPIILWFLDCDFEAKDKLKELLKIHSMDEIKELMDIDNTENDNEIYTTEKLQELQEKLGETKINEDSNTFLDTTVRNTSWKLASEDCDWSSCPIGKLPWQMGSQPIESLIVSPSEIRYAVVKNADLTNIADPKNLKRQSNIQWEDVIRKNKRSRKKPKSNMCLSTTEFEEHDIEYDKKESNTSQET